jgi:hypothetical protein
MSCLLRWFRSGWENSCDFQHHQGWGDGGAKNNWKSGFFSCSLHVVIYEKNYLGCLHRARSPLLQTDIMLTIKPFKDTRAADGASWEKWKLEKFLCYFLSSSARKFREIRVSRFSPFTAVSQSALRVQFGKVETTVECQIRRWITNLPINL